MHINQALAARIKAESRDAFAFMRQIRRDLHTHPELSGDESWTAAYLANALDKLGLEVHRNIGGHGLFADLVTDPSKPMAAFRVDMDALPIAEVNKVPYRSKFPGIMHACGHDAHSAIGVATAAIMTKLSNEIPGNLRFIFQPEEEQITGALRMIHAGVLTRPVPKAIFGLHVAPLPAGNIAWTDGLFLAGFDHYLASISPKEDASLSYPELDAVAKRCCKTIQRFNHWQLPETWQEMQDFWQLLKSPPKTLQDFIVYDASLSDENPEAWYGQFGIGVKAATPHLRRAALGRIRAALSRICKLAQTNYHIEHVGSMMDMQNDAQLVQSVLPALKDSLGESHLIHLKAAFPFNCEDFAYYTKEIPGAMFWLGAGNPEEKKYALLHTPDFDIDESSLVTGTTAISSILIEMLNLI
jgi:amidohydrolase